MKLYHDPLSSNARKAVMTAQLLGMDLELVHVDLTTGKNRMAEYLKINPMGKVPTLVDDDLVLWESHAIMQYLADKKPGNTLYPIELAARADVNRWLFWASGHWGANLALLINQNLLKKMMGKGDPDPTIVALAEGEIGRFGKVLDDHLGTRTYVCGKALTLGDLALAAPLTYAVPAKFPIDGFANIQKWFAKIQDLDAWKNTTSRRG
jgi:glutathione S-transferase